MKNRSLWASFMVALNGVRQAWAEGTNFRLMVLIAYSVLLLAAWLRLKPVEIAVLLSAIASVFVAEMVNTSVETVVDMVTREYHPLARKAKDIAAGGVLVAALISIGIGLAVFLPYLDRIPAVVREHWGRPDALNILSLGVAVVLALSWIVSVMARSSRVGIRTGDGEGRRDY